MEAATVHGVIVSLAPGGNITTELTFGLMLNVMRHISQADQALRRSEWPLMLGCVLKAKPWEFWASARRHGSSSYCPSLRHERDPLGIYLEPGTRREILSRLYAA